MTPKREAHRPGRPRFLLFGATSPTASTLLSPLGRASCIPLRTITMLSRTVAARRLARQSQRLSRASRTFTTTQSRPAEVELTIDGKKVSIEGE